MTLPGGCGCGWSGSGTVPPRGRYGPSTAGSSRHRPSAHEHEATTPDQDRGPDPGLDKDPGPGYTQTMPDKIRIRGDGDTFSITGLSRRDLEELKDALHLARASHLDATTKLERFPGTKTFIADLEGRSGRLLNIDSVIVNALAIDAIFPKKEE